MGKLNYRRFFAFHLENFDSNGNSVWYEHTVLTWTKKFFHKENKPAYRSCATHALKNFLSHFRRSLGGHVRDDAGKKYIFIGFVKDEFAKDI